MPAKLWRQVVGDARDAVAMGVPYLARHLPRRAWLFEVPIKGLGRVTLRRGSKDAEVFSQIFTQRQYDLRYVGASPAEANPAPTIHWQFIHDRYQAILDRAKLPLIIDAGANNGASALWFAGLFPQARIIAVEPDPENASLCRRNTANRNVEVLEMAIGSERGSVAIAGVETWGYSTQRSDEGSVSICTIDDIVGDRPSGELFLVKIDIEGFESDLFAANTNWIDAACVIIVEPHDWMLPWQGTSRNLQVAMASRDFEILIAGENLVYVRRDSGVRSAMAS